MIKENDGGGAAPASADGPVQALVRRMVYCWEQRIHARANNRVVRSFDWGLEWLGVASPEDLEAYAARAVSASTEYFSYTPVSDHRHRAGLLRFTSPVATPHREIGRAHV